MFSLLFLLFASLALTNSSQEKLRRDNELWLSFKQNHSKRYENDKLELLRQAIFMANKRHVELFDAKHSAKAGFELGLNHLADMSNLEVKKTFNGFKLPAKSEHLFVNSPGADKFLSDILNSNHIEVPEAVDWRKVEGRVTRVKNQSQCGSCWAFATTGALEGQERIRSGKLRSNGTVELSEQNLVDCEHDNHGCNGGFMLQAFDFIKNERGIESEKSYPYEGENGSCRFQKNKVVFSDAGGAILPKGDEEKLKQVVAKFGPVAVAIDASKRSFQLYETGVYNEKNCMNGLFELDHAVLVVGYGTDSKLGDYWIVKNSWGPEWGEKGYINMARNKGNMCGIATMATIPVF